jgi:hypothetical protein
LATINGTSGLSSSDIATLSGDALNARCFQGRVNLEEQKETGYLPRQYAYNFDMIQSAPENLTVFEI